MAVDDVAAGIDFGTTRSALTVRRGGSAVHVGTPDGLPMPSVVAVNLLTGERRVGEEASDMTEQLRETHLVVRSVKLKLAEGGQWEAANRLWTAEDVAGCIFTELRKRAEAQVGTLPDAVPTVVTTPVGFSAAGRRALRTAAAGAGFAVQAFVPESTAALFPLRRRLRAHRFVVVVDWGGGTLDVSVLEQAGRSLLERATRCLASGGDAIDSLLAEWVTGRLGTAWTDLSAKDQDYVLRVAERAKRRLSADAEVPLTFTLGARDVTLPLTRAQLTRLVAPRVEEAIGVIKAAVNAAGISVDGVGRFVFVGGSARLYSFWQAVRTDETFAGQEEFPPAPDWFVADGAALLAERGGRYLAAEGAGMLLSDGSVHPLVRPGECVEDLDRTIRVGLVEDAQAAQIPVGTYPATREGNSWTGYPERFRMMQCLTVPTMGFSDEAIDVRLWMSPDLTVHVRASSHQRGEPYEWEWSPQPLSLMYELPE